MRRETGPPTAAGWFISQSEQADVLIREDGHDHVMVVRPLLADRSGPTPRQ